VGLQPHLAQLESGMGGATASPGPVRVWVGGATASPGPVRVWGGCKRVVRWHQSVVHISAPQMKSATSAHTPPVCLTRMYVCTCVLPCRGGNAVPRTLLRRQRPVRQSAEGSHAQLRQIVRDLVLHQRLTTLELTLLAE